MKYVCETGDRVPARLGHVPRTTRKTTQPSTIHGPRDR